MTAFRYIQDVEDWLKPLDYTAFWEAVAPYDLRLFDRDHCDGLISSGEATTELVLNGLKILAVMDMRIKLGLRRRVEHPPIAPHLLSLH